jgi:itaconate CoA-transferase
MVETAIAAEPAAAWLERLEAAGLAYAEVRSIGEVLAHPQLEARRMAVTAASPVGDLPLLRFPLAAADRSRHLPGLGEHTDEVLLDAGCSPAEVARLREEGVIA